ncbi:MAG: TIGR00730 family Rossman fold protein [Acidobacteriota bacterium]
MRTLCVFCGAHAGARPEYADAALTLGRILAEQGITLVYGAGNIGLMGILADSCLAAGGKVIGVIPDALVRHEVAHLGLTELRVVESMHQRKAMMADLADAFIALPGGVGTFEELFEIWTWSQLGLQRKACGLLNVGGYYDHLIALADHAVTEGFLKQAHRDVLVVDTVPERLLEDLRRFEPVETPKWIGRDQR